MATRHVIVGGGTAGLNAIRTIRAYDRGESEVILVSAERPYSRMVLPYYLGRGIAESHVFTATPAHLAQLQVQAHLGRRAASLDTAANCLTLDDGTRIEYDDLLIATGSSAVKAPVPGADSPGVHSFWTLEQARGVVAAIREGSHVVLVGAGFIAFTILNAILALKAKLTIVEIAPQLLPRMIDRTGAEMVEKWLRRHGVAIRTGATLTAIEEAEGRRRLRFREGEDLLADVVLMATGIRTNLEWLNGSAVRVNRGIVVDDHLRSSVGNVYAAGDVAEGLDLVTGQPAVHAIEPTAMEHGRVAGANMAGQDLAYRGSLLMNIVEVCHLDIASFGAWDDPTAEAVAAARPDRWAYRKLLWKGDRLIGAMILGMANDIWTTNDVGMLKGLVQAGNGLGAWKAHLRRHPFDIKPAFIASGTTARLLPETILGRPSVPVGQVM
ncbi:MAG: NAD(P)/FAD-dependent oxidoreductase [candidate division NC10 bacterium]|nr:NAD(P)/FAD-dependent oxidoreductase [candidate division NC10 bacterium]MBI2457177.1 NAD(P)/FAD-dependent oxidoreductase [candidate division NC10 bacterium]